MLRSRSRFIVFSACGLAAAVATAALAVLAPFVSPADVFGIVGAAACVAVAAWAVIDVVSALATPFAKRMRDAARRMWRMRLVGTIAFCLSSLRKTTFSAPGFRRACGDGAATGNWRMCSST